ncbi:type II secretion system GspH family protein [Candidatus Saccharibacteria bacterium]|nr:type II secretion system GspH family protein [Candidatus Saccharibacteria bacterium]
MVGRRGFTIVELLIVIVVIAILATITVVAYTGVQNRAKISQLQANLKSAYIALEAYRAEHGEYPKTGNTPLCVGGGCTTIETRSDANCPRAPQYTDWIPGIDSLPQSAGERGTRGDSGCFLYTSDGTLYILSAWNMLPSADTSTSLYRRIGFREIGNVQYYLCNHPNIGASYPAPYDAERDYYKYSLTYTNITTCDETPPSGA